MILLYVIIILVLAIPTYGLSLMGLLFIIRFKQWNENREFKNLLDKSSSLPNIEVNPIGISSINYYNIKKKISSAFNPTQFPYDGIVITDNDNSFGISFTDSNGFSKIYTIKNVDNSNHISITYHN